MDLDVIKRVEEHYEEAYNYFKPDTIVGIFLQGSQNYGLEVPGSDIDTKLIVTPSLKEIAMNNKPCSTTYVRMNDEHIDFKDIRLMFGTFRKQNLNFLEILFTPYKILNPLYSWEFNRLIEERERIAHYNMYAAVKAMRGMAYEKYHAMEHRYSSKIEIIRQRGYNSKQLHHLVRINDYLHRYIAGESYERCLHPHGEVKRLLLDIKLNKYSVLEAREMANKNLAEIESICRPFTKDSSYNKNDTFVDGLLDDVQYNIICSAIKKEIYNGQPRSYIPVRRLSQDGH